MSPEIIAVLAILVAVIILLVTEWTPLEVLALLVMGGLAISGLVTPKEALAGFSNPAVVTIWAVFILSGGLTRTGIANILGRQLLRVAGGSEKVLVIIIMVIAGGLSAFMNNVAVAASHLIQARGLERILIVDWDVHHGNGTEDAFFMDPQVLYFSTHQAPFYPGTGPVNAVGREKGEGFTMNVPMSSGHEDSDFIRIFEDLLAPVARQFKPQFILISAGFDTHREDPLGGQALSSLGYAAMTRVLLEIAEECCPGRIVGVLEGGYNPEAQARSCLAVMDALLGSKEADKLRQAAKKTAQQPRALTEAISVQQRYWNLDNGDIDELVM